MSTGSETSPSRSGGLKQVLSKATRRKSTSKPNYSASLGSDGSDSHGFKATIEKAKVLLKPHDDDDGAPVDGGGLKKLLSKGIGNKRRKQQEQEQRDAEERDGEEVARGRKVADRATLENHDYNSFSPVPDDRSSLITYESENEESHSDTRQPLSSYPSHAGYLTTSSPLFRATTLPETVQKELKLDGANDLAFAPIKSPSTFTVATSEPTPVLSTATLQAPVNISSTKRSPSPVGRLRNALNPRRGPSISPERKNGGGFGVILRKDTEKEKSPSGGELRRGSVASRIGSIFPDRQLRETNPSTSALAISPSASPERPRAAKAPLNIETSVRPQTPPSAENPAPVIVNTPPTPTDASISRFDSSSREQGVSEAAATSNPNIVTSASGNMLSHRRVRSNSAALGPSKLSNITAAPLTPTPENGSFTPGPNSQSGFFSTVFSAAQNAASTLSNSISNTSLAPDKNRSRSSTQDLTFKAIEDVKVESVGEKEELGEPMEERELAVKTLGMGDLSLSHLGISEPSSGGNTPISSKFPDVQEQRGRSESNLREDYVQNRSLATLAGESLEIGSVTNLEESVREPGSLARPRSTYEPAAAAAAVGDHTPPNGSVFEGKTSVIRSGSVRSVIGTGSRRKRGSSAATGTTIGAAIVAANASVAHPAAGGSTPKLTGFAVASKKRNRDFHQLFRSVPEDDYLIEDYSCALQREILAHGRLYVSEGHLCFSSNIFGWVTTLVMSFDEIVSVEKRSTAIVFKNGLEISTLHAKNVFASFASRDSTYDLIVGIWKLGHPSLRSSLNGVRIEETGGGDKTEKIDGIQSLSDSEDDEDSDDGDVYDEDEDGEDRMSFTQAGEGSIAGSDVAEKVASRKPSALAMTSNGGPAEKAKEGTPTISSADFPGPATHAPTECTDQETHYDKVIADELIPAPLGKIYNMLFGPASATWMMKWLSGEQKCLEVQMEDKKGLNLDNKVRTYSYIKPLSGAIGPKQTKCIITETLDSMDLEKAISFTMSTQTPDVPSGNVFTVKTKYCLSWGEGNTTRMQMNCSIEWTGKSWLKGPIEKGANDGQVQYAKDIVTALKLAVSTKRVPAALATPGKKGKKSRREKSSKSSPGKLDGVSDSKLPVAENWGLLEPLHGPLGPIVDIIKPLLSGNMGYGLLVGLLVAAWFSFGSARTGGRDIGYYGAPQKIAAYEEIWRREEGALWDWLDERVGMERVHHMRSTGMSDQAKTIEDRLREEKVSEREIETAIKVTEEKLNALKSVVDRGKKGKASKDGAEAEK